MIWPFRWIFGGQQVALGPGTDPARVGEVEKVLTELRPSVVADGGDIRLVGIDGGTVTVSLHGACRSCSASVLTLRGALEPRLAEALPWFERLET
ncbi:MAG: NifU family protein [Planctomycetota bacterium]